VREASAPSARKVQRRGVAWQLTRVGVPAAVIVIVGAGAVMMLTGKPSEILNTRADQNAHAPGSAQAGVARGAAGGQAVGFTGYPGLHGTVTVSSFAASGGTQLAVGGADGHPAIWHRGADGRWTLVPANLPALFRARGIETLGSVAHGRAGWIAVGGNASGEPNVPVVVTSADGLTWHAVTVTDDFRGSSLYVNAVAAGNDGYVIAGQAMNGKRQFAEFWWSSDLRTWARAGNGNLDGRLASSDAYAVAATATGFVAVGRHATTPAIWTSSAGLSWTVHDFARPAGASSATLLSVAANGSRVVAVGDAATKAGGTVPFVMTSPDGGGDWRMVLLPVSGGGKITALTASGTGFVAAGEAGPAGGQHPVTWTSPDGVTWSTAAPANGTHVITALAGSGNATLAASQQDTGPSSLTLPAP
jgi:hypothetical protein